MHPSVLTTHMHTPTHFNPHHLARIFTLADFKQRCRKKRPNNSHNGAKTCAHVGGHLLLVRQCSRERRADLGARLAAAHFRGRDGRAATGSLEDAQHSAPVRGPNRGAVQCVSQAGWCQGLLGRIASKARRGRAVWRHTLGGQRELQTRPHQCRCSGAVASRRSSHRRLVGNGRRCGNVCGSHAIYVSCHDCCHHRTTRPRNPLTDPQRGAQGD
mmetsp:Transcript_73350/g.107695  ORF Transcript_73350/g.107695 Transcript_73350/m.107695 type:complete len:214 (+) Transcript_73350:188-829(+)